MVDNLRFESFFGGFLVRNWKLLLSDENVIVNIDVLMRIFKLFGEVVLINMAFVWGINILKPILGLFWDLCLLRILLFLNFCCWMCFYLYLREYIFCWIFSFIRDILYILRGLIGQLLLRRRVLNARFLFLNILLTWYLFLHGFRLRRICWIHLRLANNFGTLGRLGLSQRDWFCSVWTCRWPIASFFNLGFLLITADQSLLSENLIRWCWCVVRRRLLFLCFGICFVSWFRILIHLFDNDHFFIFLSKRFHVWKTSLLQWIIKGHKEVVFKVLALINVFSLAYCVWLPYFLLHFLLPILVWLLRNHVLCGDLLNTCRFFCDHLMRFFLNLLRLR